MYTENDGAHLYHLESHIPFQKGKQVLERKLYKMLAGRQRGEHIVLEEF